MFNRELIKENVLQKISELAAKPIDDSNFEGSNIISDLGCDSLDVINLLFSLEEQYSISIPEEEIDKLNLMKVENLINYVTSQIS